MLDFTAHIIHTACSSKNVSQHGIASFFRRQRDCQLCLIDGPQQLQTREPLLRDLTGIHLVLMENTLEQNNPGISERKIVPKCTTYTEIRVRLIVFSVFPASTKMRDYSATSDTVVAADHVLSTTVKGGHRETNQSRCLTLDAPYAQTWHFML